MNFQKSIFVLYLNVWDDCGDRSDVLILEAYDDLSLALNALAEEYYSAAGEAMLMKELQTASIRKNRKSHDWEFSIIAQRGDIENNNYYGTIGYLTIVDLMS